MLIHLLYLCAGWLVFGLIHSALATTRVKTFAADKLFLKGPAYMLLYNIISLATLAPLIYFGFIQSTGLLYKINMAGKITGWFFCTAGIIIMLLAAKNYFMFLSGLSKQASKELHTAGLHKLMRHPIYTGTFLFLFGVFILQPYFSTLVSVVIIILYTVAGTYWEEKKLINIFGQQYISYSTQTPRFIPFTKRK